MNPKYETLRTRIIKLIPEIVELKFGCWVEIDDDILGVNHPAKICEWSEQKGELTGFKVWLGLSHYRDIQKNQITKILGRTIRLADVLRAIEKSNFDEAPMVTCEGQFTDYDPETGSLHLLGKWWNLAQDDLSQQPEETWDFLLTVIPEV